jgi:preprotein translocase subunit SecA
MTDLVRQYVPAESVEEQWDMPGLEKALAERVADRAAAGAGGRGRQRHHRRGHLEKVLAAATGLRQGGAGGPRTSPFERAVLLQHRHHWREHLAALDYLRQGIHLRGYAQKQPKQEYKREAFELFRQLLDVIKNEVTRVLMTVRIQSSEQIEQAAQEARGERVSNVTYTAPTETGEAESVPEAAARSMAASIAATAAAVPRVGRNDPLSCGSGKKYKHCHGALN